jgi:hypothetical protein
MAADRRPDLEAWEMALRDAVHLAGAKCLEAFLSRLAAARPTASVRCACGHVMRSRGRKATTILTILGPVRFRRALHQCPACGQTRYPADEVLDVAGTSRSPGLRRMMARAGSQTTFKEGAADLRLYAGLPISPKDVERVAERLGAETEAWAARERLALLAAEPPAAGTKSIPVLYIEPDGTGVPMVPPELAGRRGKQPDGSARTREAKLGSVFTQFVNDEEGRPIRDPESTTFVGAIESAEDFAVRLFAEAVRRGLPQARRVVVLSDGAEWIKNLVAEYFPQALHIIDLFHAKEHVGELTKLLFPTDPNQRQRCRLDWWTALDEGRIKDLAREATALLPDNPTAREDAESHIHYLEKNKDRMRYAEFRALGLFVGSGVVEAGCKTMIGQRLKRSGMEWSVRGANAIIALRCTLNSGRFEEFWEDRAVS